VLLCVRVYCVVCVCVCVCMCGVVCCCVCACVFVVVVVIVVIVVVVVVGPVLCRSLKQDYRQFFFSGFVAFRKGKIIVNYGSARFVVFRGEGGIAALCFTHVCCPPQGHMCRRLF